MGANLTLGIYILPKLIKLFSSLCPDLKIEMFLDNTENIIKTVKRNDVSFGVYPRLITEKTFSSKNFLKTQNKRDTSKDGRVLLFYNPILSRKLLLIVLCEQRSVMIIPY
jgi:hypothetical protein